MLKKYTVLVAWIMLSTSMLFPVFAAARYDFDTEEKTALFYEMQKEIRCVACQNQSLAESNAPLANDIKAMVADKIRAGESKAAIMEFLVQRYGTFISYKPPFTWYTVLLWLVPLLAMLVGVRWITR